MPGRESRTFVRGFSSEQYSLDELRRAQLDAPRVRGVAHVDLVTPDSAGYSAGSHAAWKLGPGDEPFLTQTLQVHLVELPPHGANHGHGHQNEAAFYVLSGNGHEIHDGQRYDWGTGDLVMVHTDSVHRHYNDGGEPAVMFVVKAKATWMFAGLIQQGDSAPLTDGDRWGERHDWSCLWSPGATQLRKVVKPADTPWRTTRDGTVRLLTGPDVRCWSLDMYLQRVAPGERTARHWHMADEVLYVLSGRGASLHWEVQAEIAERYYARVARQPTRHEFSAGDLVYIPTNTVHQHVNSGAEPLLLLSASNRIFRKLGYDAVAYPAAAPSERPAHV